ncbi:MAG: hypothetical protein ACXACX_10525 [Candidatus Hodarchaeales archaeon]|jgi:hypothetical protein
MSDLRIHKIVNNKKHTAPINIEILHLIRSNRMMLLIILKKLGFTKDQILESLRNPETEIKELLFELNHGQDQVKKYCENCNELLFPSDIKKGFRYYKCPVCDEEYREKIKSNK